MKVLEILSTNMLLGGISESIMAYYRNIDKNNFEIDFATYEILDDYLNEIHNNNNKYFKLTNKRKHPIKFIIQLTKIIKDNKYDIIRIHGSSSMLLLELCAAKLAGTKIRIVHSRNTKSDFKILDIILRPIFNLLYTDCFAVGKDAGKFLFKKRDFYIIRNGKDLNKFKFNKDNRDSIRKKYKIDEETILLGCVANFNYQKNHEYLIDVFNCLIKKTNKKYKMFFIGIGPLEGELKEKINNLKLNDNVIFVGRTHQVEKYLSAMDIMVLTSRFEGFPNVLIEWQIAGLPCIISDMITTEVKITDLVEFESIDKEPEVWAKKIDNIELQDRQKNQSKILNEIIKAGFDIKENTKYLERIYKQIYNERIIKKG